MILLLSGFSSARLQYICEEIFTRRLGLDFKITESEDYFLRSNSFRVNYGNKFIEGVVNVPAVNLLYEENIKPYAPDALADAVWLHRFFSFSYPDTEFTRLETVFIPFDIFSASFFLMSRYEEYLPHHADAYQRYRAAESLAFRAGFLEAPLIDVWVKVFSELIKKHYPEINIKQPAFRELHTIDLDFPYQYRGIGYWRNFKKFGANLLRRDLDAIKKQLGVLKGDKDPFDTYDLIHQMASTNQAELKYFFLLAENEGKHDKNPDPRSTAMLRLIQRLGKECDCGIHPSFQSFGKERVLSYEIRLFVKLFAPKILRSRAHFLRVRLPDTYRKYIAHGVKEDYSLAYSEQAGFRASTAIPFYFFDLASNEETGLLLLSPYVMDVTLKNFMKLNPEAAMERIWELKDRVQAVGGNFISIWHNSSLTGEGEWKGWKPVFESLFR